MNKRNFLVLLCAFLFLSGQATIQASPQSDVLYGVNASDDGLSVIDPTTGVVTFVGPLDPDPNLLTTPVAMAVRPSDGTIFVWNNSDLVPTGVLLTVDPCTGLASKIGGNSGAVLGALAFAPNGMLFGVTSSLLEINPDTGALTLKGPVGEAVFAADFDAGGTLFGLTLENVPGEPLTRVHKLLEIDTSNGAIISFVTLDTDVGVPGSIVFDPTTGTLIGSAFGGSSGNILFDINASTGAVTHIRTLSGGFAPQGMGFAPACEREESVTQTFGPGVTAQNFSFDDGNHTFTVTFDEVLTTFDLTITAVDTLQSVVKPRINVEVEEGEEEFPDSECVPYASGLCVVYVAEDPPARGDGQDFCSGAAGPDCGIDIYIGFLPLNDAGIRGRTTNWSEFVVVSPGVEFAKALLQDPDSETGNDFTKDITTDFLSNGLPIKELGTFCGIQPPVRADGSSDFKAGRKVPLKFKLSRLPDCSGDFITDAVARISSIVGTPNDGNEGILVQEFEDSGAPNTGNLFGFNPESLQYVFILSTKGFASKTTQEVTIGSDKFLPVKIEFGIR